MAPLCIGSTHMMLCVVVTDIRMCPWTIDLSPCMYVYLRVSLSDYDAHCDILCGGDVVHERLCLVAVCYCYCVCDDSVTIALGLCIVLTCGPEGALW